MVFSTDGNLLSSACADENTYVWDIYAILKAAGLEDLLFIPDVSTNLTRTRYYLIPNDRQTQNSELSKKVCIILWLFGNETRSL